MVTIFRILFCCIVAIIVLFLCSYLWVLLGLEKLTILHILGAVIGYLSGKYLNSFLKKKFPSKKV